jgi:hypothetical protein
MEIEVVMPQNSQFVKEPLAMRLHDSNDALYPAYGEEKSFMCPTDYAGALKG